MQAGLARWNALGSRGRQLAIAFAAAALVAIVLAGFLGRDTRVLLFASPLRTDQLAEVVDRLAEWNEAFIVKGDNVSIDGRRRNAVLLKLAAAGVPHAHLESSAEALAKAGPLTPQSVLEAQQREGLAGDIASGLRGLAGVDDAHVIIAPAREGAFANERSVDATASVRLNLRPGATPSSQTLEGIRQFVAAGVPGLDPRRVAVLDDRGIALENGSAASADEAQSLQTALQSALDLALGEAAAIVRVRISYDPRNRETRSVVRKPLSGHAIASTTADEHYKSASKQYAKLNTSVDYGSEVQDERVDTPAGRLERISVAVAVDATRHFDTRKIRSLAEGTLGLSPARGDAVSVEEIAFRHRDAPARSLPVAAALGFIASVAPSCFLGLAFLAALRFGAKPALQTVEAMVQRISVRRATHAVAGFAPSHVRGALQNEPPHTAAAIISALPAATATAVLEMYSAEERAAIVRRMSRAAAPVVPDYESVLRRG